MNVRLIGVTTMALSANEQRALCSAAASQLAESRNSTLVSLPRRQVSAPAWSRTAWAALRDSLTAWG